jgi:predicted RNA binding protein YcfA (HicA-like mRNA interferase family)
VAQLDKLIRRFLQRPPAVRFSEVRRLLGAFGFSLVRTRGSHHLFEHPDGRQLCVPVKDQRVKRVYVLRVVEMLDLERYS